MLSFSAVLNLTEKRRNIVCNPVYLFMYLFTMTFKFVFGVGVGGGAREHEWGRRRASVFSDTGIVIPVQYFRIFRRNCLSFEFLNSVLLLQHRNAETNKASCQSGFICLIAEIDVPITINSINLFSVFCADTVSSAAIKIKKTLLLNLGFLSTELL